VTVTLTRDELRTLFLFEALPDDRLDWLAEHGRVEDVPAGVVFAEGEPATCFYVLLDGELALSRRVGPDDVETTRSSQRGVYMGAAQAYLGDAVDQRYSATMRATRPSRFFVLSADAFATMMRDWFPMAMHLLEGLFFGIRNSQQVVGQRERLLALGALSAGLTHELNNPAAAAVRATASLRERVAGMRHKLAALADGRLPQAAMAELVALQEDAVERASKGRRDLTSMEVSDREDALTDWLDQHGVRGSYDLAPVFVAAGLDVGWLDEVASRVPDTLCEGALRWLAYAVETEHLMGEIEDSVGRISTLVGAAKQYSQMDRAPYTDTDLHEGLDSTLVMLGGRLAGVRVVRDYDRSLPRLPAYAAELNQVWTNLVDNAAAAMGGSGTLHVRTRRDGDRALVEIEDSGPGIPEAIRNRVFEPFFTTKPGGEGTGLGLDISYRIVVNRHGGDLRVESAPGRTVFSVRLPIDGPDAVVAG
jgi:signal transduction histidine kinase